MTTDIEEFQTTVYRLTLGALSFMMVMWWVAGLGITAASQTPVWSTLLVGILTIGFVGICTMYAGRFIYEVIEDAE